MTSDGITEDSYSLVENISEEFYGVKLRDEQFDGIIVVYGAVSISMPEESGEENAKLSFNYNIKDPGKYQPDQLQKSPAFNEHLGDVLTHIIVTQLDKQETCIGRPEE